MESKEAKGGNFEALSKCICKVEAEPEKGTGFLLLFKLEDDQEFKALVVPSKILTEDKINNAEFKFNIFYQEKKIKITLAQKDNKGEKNVLITPGKKNTKDKNDFADFPIDIFQIGKKEDGEEKKEEYEGISFDTFYQEKNVQITLNQNVPEKKRLFISFKDDSKDISILEIKPEDGIPADSFIEVDTTNEGKENEAYKNNSIIQFRNPTGELQLQCLIDNNGDLKVIGICKEKDDAPKIQGTILKDIIEKLSEGKPQNYIICYYRYQQNMKTKLFNKEYRDYINDITYSFRGFNKENVEIFVNDEQVKFSDEVKCKGLPPYKVKFVLKEQLTNCANMFCNCKDLFKADISKLDLSKVTDMNSMFFKCSNLTEVKLPKSEENEITNLSNMFMKCKELIKVESLAKINTSKVTNMKGIFNGCEKLPEIDLSGLKTNSVTNLSSMFEFCNELKSVNLQGFDTKKVTGFEAMFHRCQALKTLDLSCFNTENAENLSGMFDQCPALTEINLSNFAFKDDNVNTSWLFIECKSLTKVDLSKCNEIAIEKIEKEISEAKLSPEMITPKK